MGDTMSLVRRIIARRRAAGDDDRHLLGDDDRDALGAVRYVRAHRRVGVDQLREDVLDALAITERLRAEVDAEQAALLRMARGYPVRISWQRIADAMCMRSRQGPRDRLRRLEAGRAGSTDVEARGDLAVRRRRAAWLAEPGRGDAVRELAAAWQDARDLVPGEWAEDVDELAEASALEALALRVRDLGRELAAAGAGGAGLADLIARTRGLFQDFPAARISRT